jgi:hypothetical protein
VAGVRDEVRDLTGGDGRKASELAWQAITGPMGDVQVLWTGKPGARVVTLRPTSEAATVVLCPECGAEKGEPCMRMTARGRTGTPKSWPHDQREAAFIEKLALVDF